MFDLPLATLFLISQDMVLQFSPKQFLFVREASEQVWVYSLIPAASGCKYKMGFHSLENVKVHIENDYLYIPGLKYIYVFIHMSRA